MPPTLFARSGARAVFPRIAFAGLAALATSVASAATFTATTPDSLIAAINSANSTPEADTIALSAGTTYTFTAVDNFWYGPNALPPIASPITIEGHGATLAIDVPVRLRFFYIGADPASPRTPGYHSPGAGRLTLRHLTLTGGKARGGNANQGGGGAGLGGAIFNQGTLLLDCVTLRNNTAIGGIGGTGSSVCGGGMGADATAAGGGGFGGPVSPAGSAGIRGGGDFGFGGECPVSGTGGGGAGFGSADNAPESGAGGGTRDGLGGVCASGSLSGAGSGSGGGATSIVTGGGIGGGGGWWGGGGFGGGAGGSNGGFVAYGGFGGGGGGGGVDASLDIFTVDDGGFGGGMGCMRPVYSPGPGGGGIFVSYVYIGGGGAGMGGAIFNHGGQLSLANCTLSANSAEGGSSANSLPGHGYGGAVFNLNGAVELRHCTLVANSAVMLGADPASGGALYNLRYTLLAASPAASVSLANCILARSTGGADLVSNCPPTLVPATGGDANTGTATVTLVGANLVGSSVDSGSAISSGNPPLTDDPLLAPLGNYGGDTETIALLPGSRAIDAGYVTFATGTPINGLDQRGRVRTEYPDLGAFESQGFTFVKTGGDRQSTAPGTAFPAPLAVEVVANLPIEPVNGGIVSFTPPATGPSAVLSATTATIASDAVAVTATANATTGMYQIPVAARGATTARFTLGNGVFGYAAWAAARFTAAELADPAISGEGADPDHTGLANLLRYAFDLPARGPVTDPTEFIYHGSGGSSAPALAFPLRADGIDISYTVLTSVDLSTWDEVATVTSSGTARTIAYTVTAPPGANRFFMCLRVAKVP